MAEHLASIFGTEKDRVNCPFYFKIGACRHGDRCSRLHNRPTISPTLLLSNMYLRPDMITPGVDEQGQPIDPRKIQEHFEDFYEDIFEELSKFGEIESLNVCDNLADHMIGNVYVQFKEEDQAAAALQALQGRFYSGRPIIADFSPVTDFREATCRQFEENSCNRGGYCNFMHVKLIGRELRRKLFGRFRGYRISRSRSRSSSPRHRREHRDYRDRDRDYGGNVKRLSKDRYDRDGGGAGRRRHATPRRSRSPVTGREGSEERRARIEQWNREREEKQARSDTLKILPSSKLIRKRVLAQIWQAALKFWVVELKVGQKTGSWFYFLIRDVGAIEVKVVQKTGQVVWKSKKQVATTFLMTHWLHDSMGQKLVEGSFHDDTAKGSFFEMKMYNFLKCSFIGSETKPRIKRAIISETPILTGAQVFTRFVRVITCEEFWADVSGNGEVCRVYSRRMALVTATVRHK